MDQDDVHDNAISADTLFGIVVGGLAFVIILIICLIKCKKISNTSSNAQNHAIS